MSQYCLQARIHGTVLTNRQLLAVLKNQIPYHTVLIPHPPKNKHCIGFCTFPAPPRIIILSPPRINPAGFQTQFSLPDSLNATKVQKQNHRSVACLFACQFPMGATGRRSWAREGAGGRGRGGGVSGGRLAHHWQRPKTLFKPIPRQPHRIKIHIYI